MFTRWDIIRLQENRPFELHHRCIPNILGATAKVQRKKHE